MTTRFHNMSVDKLLVLLTNKVNHSVTAIQDAAEILYELHTRGESHPFMREGIFKFYKEIARLELSPKAVMVFAGIPSILNQIKGLPLEQQDAIAMGETVSVVEIDAKGGLTVVEKPVLRLNQKQLERVIQNGCIVPVSEQEKKARAEAAKVPIKTNAVSRIKVDKKSKLLIFGAMKFSPEDLRDSLRELGFKLTRIDSRNRTDD